MILLQILKSKRNNTFLYVAYINNVNNIIERMNMNINMKPFLILIHINLICIKL